VGEISFGRGDRETGRQKIKRQKGKGAGRGGERGRTGEKKEKSGAWNSGQEKRKQRRHWPGRGRNK